MIKTTDRKLAETSTQSNSQTGHIIGRRAFVAAIAAMPAIIAFGYAERGVTADASGDSHSLDSGASG
ncbi:MAG: hypothetical protein WAU69_14110, partial [Solirubrobacteraceae bacterium]